MTVRVSKPEFNLRDKLSQLDRRVGSAGGEILASKSPREAQGLIGVGSKNILINGGMQVAQRGTSTNPQGSSTNQYPCCDRWGGQFSDSNVFTVSQSTDAPVGHHNSLKFETINAVSPSGSHYFHIGQNIEGHNFAATGWNASESGRTETKQPCTLSFWVKSSNPGKWCASLKGMGNHTHSYLIVYEIEKPNTWEWKTHTIYPSTEINNWTTGNAAAMRIQFDVGTSRVSDLGTGVVNKWQNHNTYTYNNDKFQPTRIHGISGATWYLTGVQFEPGPVATPFEHRSYGEELQLCMRYFQKVYNAQLIGTMNTSTRMRIMTNFPVPMRGTSGSYTRTSNDLKFQINGAVESSSNTTEAQGGSVAHDGINTYARTWDFGGFTTLANRSFIGGNGAHVFNMDSEL